MTIIHYQNNPMIQCDYCGRLLGKPDHELDVIRLHMCDDCSEAKEDNNRRASEEE